MSALWICVISSLVLQCDSFFLSRRRRRAPRPVAVDCSLSDWETTEKCTAPCGTDGIEVQTRRIITVGRNGGKECSAYDLEREVPCNRVCYNTGEINYITNKCDCPKQWTGKCCNEDVNECETSHPCNQICHNREGSYYCDCEENFTLDTDNKNCVVAADCQQDPPPCTHRCKQLPGGGYQCYCDPGFELAGDGRSCSDIDECKRGSICQKKCINTPGDFRCECKVGFYLNSDNKTCTDIDECVKDNGGCEQECENTIGGHRCRCGFGYYLDDDMQRCIDRDECVQHGAALCGQLCVNTPGSYDCVCERPFTLNSDLRTCTCSGDSAACNDAKAKVDAQRGDGSSNDTMYNWIIGVLLAMCVVLFGMLGLMCYRKKYYKILAPKPPPVSTIPRHHNVMFSTDIGDEDDASGVYEDPDENLYEQLEEDGYLEISDPLHKPTREDEQDAKKPKLAENEYSETGPTTSRDPSSNPTSNPTRDSMYVEGDLSQPQPEGDVYVTGDQPSTSNYSTRAPKGAAKGAAKGAPKGARLSKGFDHEEDFENNPPFYDNI